VNYYVNRHPLKVQADFRRLADKGRATADHELRAQVQFLF
jgi:hypothetical protein